jgi:hypothetical protein
VTSTLKKICVHSPTASVPTVLVAGLIRFMRWAVVTHTKVAVRLFDAVSPVLQTLVPTGKRCGIDFTARLLSTPITFQVVGSTEMTAAADAGEAGTRARPSASRPRETASAVALVIGCRAPCGTARCFVMWCSLDGVPRL